MYNTNSSSSLLFCHVCVACALCHQHVILHCWILTQDWFVRDAPMCFYVREASTLTANHSWFLECAFVKVFQTTSQFLSVFRVDNSVGSRLPFALQARRIFSSATKDNVSIVCAILEEAASRAMKRARPNLDTTNFGGQEGGGRGGMKRWGHEGWWPEGWGAQNFALCFPFSRSHFHSFFSLSLSLSLSLSPGIFSCLFFSLSLWRSFRGILVVFWSVGTSNVLDFPLGLSCGSPWRLAARPAVRRDGGPAGRAVQREGGPAGGRSGGRAVRREGGPRRGAVRGGESPGRGGSVGQNRPKLANLKVVAKVCLAVAKVGLAVAKVGLAKVGRGQSGSWPKKVLAKEGRVHSRSWPQCAIAP